MKHFLSNHTFPRRTATVTETSPQEEPPAPAVETPVESLTEVEDVAMRDAQHSLVWEGLLSLVVDSDETMVELIVRFDGEEDPPHTYPTY